MSLLWNETDEIKAIINIKHQIKILDLLNNKINLQNYIIFLESSLSKSNYENYRRILIKCLL